MTAWIWLGIVLSLTQAGIFSGLNLAVFSVSKLRLKVEAASGNQHARNVLALRRDSNLLLTTILWGNVAANVLLAQLASSVLAGVLAFLFSTVLLTLAGEVFPQAYFSRNALRIASMLSPMLRFYRFILFPVAKPTAMILDRLLGPEKVDYLTEHALRELITLHAQAKEGDIGSVEGRGAINFLAIDDLPVSAEGEPVDPQSIVRMVFDHDNPVFPPIERSSDDPFIRRIHQSGRKWIVLVDAGNIPRLVLNADCFLRDALLEPSPFNPHQYCHRPLLVTEESTRLGRLIPLLGVQPQHSEDDVIDDDIILLWGAQKRVITGADILGRLLRGIVETVDSPPPGP